jgi:hypothetical protein
MTLTKSQRAAVREMFGGCCAYCGNELREKWHADHVEPVLREYWKKGGGFQIPERDIISNLFPSCAPCNIHKHAMSLEDWRNYLQDQVAMARRNSAPFRHAERFKMITVSDRPIVFHFEKYSAVQHG